MIDLTYTKDNKVYENMLPLIDIVFLLLIFFLLAGSFISPEVFTVEPPTSLVDKVGDARDDIVLINQNGELGFLGEIIQDSQLHDYARQANHEVIKIKADESAKAARVIEIIELLQDAGIKKVELLTVAE